jgi:hypothetical protein
LLHFTSHPQQNRGNEREIVANKKLFIFFQYSEQGITTVTITGVIVVMRPTACDTLHQVFTFADKMDGVLYKVYRCR